MGEQRLVIYVTLLNDCKTVEFYAVHDGGDGRSDLWNDGHCSLSRMPLAVVESLIDWSSERTAERASS